MELADIEKLVEKYLNADTSLEEEKILFKYFTSEKVASHLNEFSVLFNCIKEDRKEILKRPIRLKPEIKIKKNFEWLSVAVSAALLFSFYLGYSTYKKQEQRRQFMQIKEALQMVSLNLNKGNKALYTVSNSLSKSQEAIGYIATYERVVNKLSTTINEN